MPTQGFQSLLRAILAALIVVAVGCGDQTKTGAGEEVSIEDRIRATLPDGPLTEEARSQIALLVDTLQENDRDAYRAIRQIGRDAVPALVEALYGPYNETIKRNALYYLGHFGLAADKATPFVEDVKIKGPTWVSFAAGQALQQIKQARTCGLPDLPRDVEVHVVGRYRGAKELDIQLGKSGHAVTEIEVVVDRTEKPVVLVLTAYDPVVWRVGQTGTSRLAAVLVSGYHTQALLGIPREMPHKVISGESSLGCKTLDAPSGSEVPLAEADVLALTGHAIDEFHGVSPESFFRIGGDPQFKPSIVEFSDDLSLDDYDVYKGDIPAGPRGVDELERRGEIRRATKADIDAWIAGAREQHPDTRIHIHTGNVYVALEDITLPPGLFGAQSRAFIIPEGVAKPSGPKGHCQFYYMEDFTRE